MTASLPFLPYGRHVLDDRDIEAVVQVLRGDWLTTGPTIEAFEAAFAEAVQARDAIVVSIGTAALHLASLALDLGPDDAVIVPAITFVTTANAPHLTGAQVIFADVDAETGLMGESHFAAALTRAQAKHVRAVFPVHLGGQSENMAAIGALARQQGIAVIEDACHALGSAYTGAGGMIGDCRHSDMAAFSLHPVKTAAMGEGGVITTNDGQLASRLRQLRNHGLIRDCEAWRNASLGFDAAGNPNPWYYEMHAPGFNYRASDIHCALGLSQLGKLRSFAGRRRELVEEYDRQIVRLGSVVRPLGRAPSNSPAWHLYVALIDFETAGISRGEVMRRLHGRCIGTQVHYIPVHLQPYYREQAPTPVLAGAEAYYARCLSLPLFPAMTTADVTRVVDALAEELGLNNRRP